jgi:hypothetical protein
VFRIEDAIFILRTSTRVSGFLNDSLSVQSSKGKESNNIVRQRGEGVDEA